MNKLKILKFIVFLLTFFLFLGILSAVGIIYKRIKTPTLVSGVGGSNVVSEFTSKVLREKNGIIALNNEPRNLIYDNLSGFDNVIACSYSGNNFGVDLAFRNDLKNIIQRLISLKCD